MLDDVTKKRINSLRQILVGKLPDPKAQVEQITNGLIYKFMNDMDEQSVSMGGKSTYFSGKFQKYSWNNLLDTKTSGVEKIKLYSEAIEQMYTNKNLPELFREIFKNSFLPFKDPSTLNMFLKEINEFHYSHSEKLGDAFEYLLSFMGSQGDAGQFRTPRHIIDFIVDIVNPQKNEKILDPACGTAGFLISSYKHILNQNTKKNLGDGLTASDRKKIGENLNGYDISPDMVKMSLVNMYLHKFTNPKINEYDTLSSEDRWNEYYDVILANPPFFSPKGGIVPHNRFGVNSSKAEVLFIDYINEHLKPNGRAGIIVPEGVIFQTGATYKQLRKKLIETSLVGVISLPAGIFQPYSGVKTSILILDKKNKNNDKVFFANIKNDGYSLGSQRNLISENDLPQIISDLKDFPKIKNNEKITLVDKTEIINSDNFNLSLNHYSKSDIKSNYKVVKLKDVLKEKPLYGSGASKTDFDKNVRYIRITDINKYGYLKSEKVVSPSKIEKEYFLKFGDILFARSGSVGRCYLHKELNGNYQFAGYLIKFPLNKELINPNYLFYISRSNFYLEWIKSIKRQGTISNINAKEYSSFEFPLPSLETQNQIVEELNAYQKIIDGCRQIIENYKPSIDIDLSWETVGINDLPLTIIDGDRGKSYPSGSDFSKDGYCLFLNTKNVLKNGFNFDETMFVTKEKDNQLRKGKLLRDDVILTTRGTIGNCAIFNDKVTFDNIRINSGMLIFRCNKEVLLPEYLFYYFQSSNFHQDINLNKSGSAQPQLPISSLKNIKIPIPSVSEQEKIINILKKQIELVDGNHSLCFEYENKIKNKIDSIWLN